jgi:hypothetical protein
VRSYIDSEDAKSFHANFLRRTDFMPKPPTETKYHPSSVNIELLKTMRDNTKATTLVQFLQKVPPLPRPNMTHLVTHAPNSLIRDVYVFRLRCRTTPPLTRTPRPRRSSRASARSTPTGLWARWHRGWAATR